MSVSKSELNHLLYSSEEIVFHFEQPESGYTEDKTCYDIVRRIASWAKGRTGFDGFDVDYGYNFDIRAMEAVDALHDKAVSEIRVAYGTREHRLKEEWDRRVAFCWAVLHTSIKNHSSSFTHVETGGKWISKYELTSLAS